MSRPTASLSTYYECKIAEEARADALVSEVFAPIFDRHVAAGERAGHYYTCVNSFLKAEELAYILNNSESRVLITSAPSSSTPLRHPISS